LIRTADKARHQVFEFLLFEYKYLSAGIIANQPEYCDVQGNIALLPGPANNTLAVTLVTFTLLKLISAFRCDFISESTLPEVLKLDYYGIFRFYVGDEGPHVSRQFWNKKAVQSCPHQATRATAPIPTNHHVPK
jgi:hypothetical protein